MALRGTDDRGEPRGVGLGLAAATLAAAGLLTVAAVFGGRWLFTDRDVQANHTDARPSPVPLFTGWAKPDLALVLSAQQHGYMLPCGCSRPQVGGLERRYNFVQSLKKNGWPIHLLDLGDVAQQHGPQNLPNVQGLIKYRYSMEALKRIGYAANTFGEYETALPLERALAEFQLNNPLQPATVVANLAENADPLLPTLTKPFLLSPNVGGTNLSVGVIGVVGPSVAGRIKDPGVRFAGVPVLLPRVLDQMKAQNPDLVVLLYQGLPREAKACAAAIKGIHVILCLTEEDEPSGRPERVGDTLIVGVGHKGKYVGVVGVFRKPGHAPELKYQLVSMSEDYLTPEGQEASNPVLGLMEEYTQELKKENYLARYVGQMKHPMQVDFPDAVYVGSEKCQRCHQQAYKVWKESGHSHAYDTLVKAKRPSLRQYDGECVVCHVVGFSYHKGFVSEVETPQLKHVGCESCHGPASLHIKNNNNPKVLALLNPWKAPANEDPEARKKRLTMIDLACQKCHDTDNDVHWDFEKKWPKVAHPEPKD